jgi:nucleoside-diphosphate-sugar epimerase
MRLLVIGGTAFLGRAVVEEALSRGDDVTTFNRGRTGPDLPGVRTIRGDREVDADLAALDDVADVDGVVDTCGFVPRVVGESARRLVDRARRYVFVSSMSSTTTWPHSPTPDGADGQPCPGDAGPDDGDYGVLKAGCERAVTPTFGDDRATVVRAGLILGPHENVGRLPWWLRRIAAGGEVLAPGDQDARMQLVDARDLAAFMLHCIEHDLAGTFNATGPQGNATMGSWLGDCVAVTGSDARLTWVDDELLLSHQVEPWTELPLWMPPGQGADHVWTAETAAAELAGLRSRPVAETVRDTWEWVRAGGSTSVTPPQHAGRAQHGIDPVKEKAILAEWHAR